MLKSYSSKTLLVTVGTTSFDPLIEIVTSKDFCEAAVKAGYSRLVIQYGRGTIPKHIQGVTESASQTGSLPFTPSLEVVAFPFKDSIKEYIRNAEMVIGHAGAATAIETLRAKKKLLLVVNETLMANHQWELARALELQGCALTATPFSLLQTFASAQQWNPTPFPNPTLEHLDHVLTGLLGVSVL